MSSSRSQQTTKNCSTHSVPVLVHTLANISSRNPEPKIRFKRHQACRKESGCPFHTREILEGKSECRSSARMDSEHRGLESSCNSTAT